MIVSDMTHDVDLYGERRREPDKDDAYARWQESLWETVISPSRRPVE